MSRSALACRGRETAAIYLRLSCHCSILWGAYEPFYISVCRKYIATLILQGHLPTSSTACASSVAVAWNWISRHHHALLNNSSLSNPRWLPWETFWLVQHVTETGNCLLRGRIGGWDREISFISLFCSLGIGRETCFTQTAHGNSRRGDVRSKHVSLRSPSWVPEWPAPAQIVLEIWNSIHAGLHLPLAECVMHVEASQKEHLPSNGFTGVLFGVQAIRYGSRWVPCIMKWRFASLPWSAGNASAQVEGAICCPPPLFLIPATWGPAHVASGQKEKMKRDEGWNFPETSQCALCLTPRESQRETTTFCSSSGKLLIKTKNAAQPYVGQFK